MDIAKIRKKLKDLESRQPAVEGETPGIREENPSDNQMREPEAIHENGFLKRFQSRAEPETSGMENTSSAEKKSRRRMPRKRQRQRLILSRKPGLPRKKRYNIKRKRKVKTGMKPTKRMKSSRYLPLNCSKKNLPSGSHN